MNITEDILSKKDIEFLERKIDYGYYLKSLTFTAPVEGIYAFTLLFNTPSPVDCDKVAFYRHGYRPERDHPDIIAKKRYGTSGCYVYLTTYLEAEDEIWFEINAYNKEILCESYTVFEDVARLSCSLVLRMTKYELYEKYVICANKLEELQKEYERVKEE